VQVHIRGDSSDLASKPSNLISQHTRSRRLDGIVPIVVVVAQGVGEVQNGHLTNVGRVLSYVEVSRFDTTLGHGVRHQEEVKFTVNHFGLLDEALIDVSTLGRVINESLAVLVRLLEETLADSLVHNDERHLGWIVLTLLTIKESVLLLDDLVQLFELKIDDLLTH
jgi:hypothetical protein